MKSYSIYHEQSDGTYVIRDSQGLTVKTKIPTRTAARNEIIRMQNAEIYEDVLRRAIRREYLRAVEDMQMDRKRVRQILCEEIGELTDPKNTGEFKPTVISFIREE